MTLDDWVVVWSGRYSDFDLWILGGERGKGLLEEGAGWEGSGLLVLSGMALDMGWALRDGYWVRWERIENGGDKLHAFGAPCPVTVVEVETFAL